MLTEALGTAAPVESVTWPLMRPCAVCANAPGAARATAVTNTASVARSEKMKHLPCRVIVDCPPWKPFEIHTSYLLRLRHTPTREQRSAARKLKHLLKGGLTS